jgi:hypothetical protein
VGVHLDDRLPGQWHGGQFGERLDRHRDHDDVTGRRGLPASDESHSRHVLSVPPDILSVPPEEPNPCHLPDSLRFGSLPSAGGEVMAVVQIGEQAGLSGFPAEGPAGDEAGRRVALRDDARGTRSIPAPSVRPREHSRRAGPGGCQWPRRSRGWPRPRPRASICRPAPSPTPNGTRRLHPGRARRSAPSPTDETLLLRERDQCTRKPAVSVVLCTMGNPYEGPH